MKIWYKAVCDMHGEACDVMCNNPTLSAAYLAEHDAVIEAWLTKHYGCELRLVWRDDQLDELWKTVDYRSIPTRRDPDPAKPEPAPLPPLIRVRGDQLQVGDVIVQGGSRGYRIHVTEPPKVVEGSRGPEVRLGALGFAVSDRDEDLFYVLRPAADPHPEEGNPFQQLQGAVRSVSAEPGPTAESEPALQLGMSALAARALGLDVPENVPDGATLIPVDHQVTTDQTTARDLEEGRVQLDISLQFAWSWVEPHRKSDLQSRLRRMTARVVQSPDLVPLLEALQAVGEPPPIPPVGVVRSTKVAESEDGSVSVHLASVETPAPVRQGPDSLGEALPREMARVRDELLPVYQSLGPAGTFAVLGMRADLDRAAKALAEQDVIAMIQVFNSLKEWGL